MERALEVPISRPSAEDAVSAAVSYLYLNTFGKAPAQVETSIRGDVIVSVLHDVFTPAEKLMLAAGRQDSVLTTRMLWQHSSNELFNAAVGDAIGRVVLATISGFEVEHALACEVFVLAPA